MGVIHSASDATRSCWLANRSPFDQCDRGVSREGIAALTAIYAQLQVIFEASDSFKSYHPNPIYFSLVSDP